MSSCERRQTEGCSAPLFSPPSSPAPFLALSGGESPVDSAGARRVVLIPSPRRPSHEYELDPHHPLPASSPPAFLQMASPSPEPDLDASGRRLVRGAGDDAADEARYSRLNIALARAREIFSYMTGRRVVRQSSAATDGERRREEADEEETNTHQHTAAASGREGRHDSAQRAAAGGSFAAAGAARAIQRLVKGERQGDTNGVQEIQNGVARDLMSLRPERKSRRTCLAARLIPSCTRREGHTKRSSGHQRAEARRVPFARLDEIRIDAAARARRTPKDRTWLVAPNAAQPHHWREKSRPHACISAAPASACLPARHDTELLSSQHPQRHRVAPPIDFGTPTLAPHVHAAHTNTTGVCCASRHARVRVFAMSCVAPRDAPGTRTRRRIGRRRHSACV